jgi:V-type H+-transporting ATPase subunit D
MLSLNNADGQAKRLMGRVLQLASFSLAEVTYTAGDIGYQVQESVKKATYTVQAKQENVSGVVLPAFEGVKSKDGSGACPSACIDLLDVVRLTL